MHADFEHVRQTPRSSGYLWAAAVTLLALILRTTSLTHGLGAHPDERHIIMVTTGLSLADLNPHSFAYGSLPFYLLWGIAQLLSFLFGVPFGYDNLFMIGRSLAAAIGSLTVLTIFLSVRRLTSSTLAATAAALFLALNRFHIQLSRYFTVDILLSFLVLLAVLSVVHLMQRQKLSDYLRFGALFGLALATKISALFLLAPLSVAVVWYWVSTRTWAALRSWGYLGALFAVTILVWFLAAPYTVFDFETFVRHSREQINMTRGLWRPPYTIQYATTTPYLYPLQQMFHFTFGWPAFLLAGCAFGSAIIRGLRSRHSTSILIVVTMLALFGATGGLFVKFPRYLLPLYPLAAVLVGLLVATTSRRSIGDRLVRGGVVAVGLWMFVSALAFVRIYGQPHVYELASRWIVENVPPGSRILGVHWDDRLPVGLPGISLPALRYSYEGPENELAIYEADSPQKSQLMATRLAQSDYLVFPTARTYAPLARLPEEFPNTNRLITALFRNELGFELQQSVKVTPAIGMLKFPDDLADESFTVYDHPKVLVFKNTGRFSAEQILGFMQQGRPSLPFLNATELLNTVSTHPLPDSWPDSSWTSLLIWVLLLELLAWAAVPWLVLMFRNLPDRALGCSKLIGPFFLASLLWTVGWYSGAAISVPQTRLVFLAFVGLSAGLAWWLHVRREVNFVAELRPHFLRVEGLFIGGILLAALLRSFAPEIFWGEKPMDFTFLNYFVRLETLPPQDPWAAGGTMNYYYLGVYLCAALLKVTGISTGIGYNLALAAVVGWLLTAAYSLLMLLVGRRVVAIWGSILVVLGSNAEVLRLWLVERRAANFDLFWASSRVFTSPAITEYPIWSFLFADLHAHVIALPVVMVLLALSCGELKRRSEVVWPLMVIGFMWGTLLGLNTWDFIAVAVVIGLLWLIRLHLVLRSAFEHGSSFFGALGRWLGEVIIVGLAGAAAAVPWLSLSNTATPIGYGWVRAEFSTLPQVLYHLGIWMVLILSSCCVLIGTWRLWRMSFLRWVVVGLCAATPFVAVAVSVTTGTTEIRLLLPGMLAVFMAIGGWLMVTPKVSVETRGVGALLLAGALVATGAELAFLMDRMNTIFKFYQLVWLCFSVSGIALYAQVRRITRDQGLKVRRLVVGVLATVVVALSVTGSALNMGIMTSFHRVPGIRPTLDGAAYLESADPALAKLVRWLQKNVKGVPVILEAFGNSYGAFTRIAMFTGIPTVLGWEHHVWQRGTSRAEIAARREAISAIYGSGDAETAQRLLQKYQVRWIVIGELERETYPGPGLSKFSRYPEMFALRYQYRNDLVYEFMGLREGR